MFILFTSFIPAPSGAGFFFSVGLFLFPALPIGLVPASLCISCDIKKGFFGQPGQLLCHSLGI
nr:MAG TPA: hypothetical protein [Caudoviricetes sp.]